MHIDHSIPEGIILDEGSICPLRTRVVNPHPERSLESPIIPFFIITIFALTLGIVLLCV